MKSSFPLDRVTKQRQILVEVLDRKNWHPSAEELYKIVRRELPNVSLGTIYRNLEQLAQKRAIMVIEEAGMQRLYDGNPKPHYHVKCLKCGQVNDVPDEAVKWVQQPLVDMPDFTITGHRIVFTGFCSKCRVHDVDKEVDSTKDGN